MSLFWQRLVTAVGVLVVTTVAAKLVDWRISKRSLDPSVATRYRVLRRIAHGGDRLRRHPLGAARHPSDPHRRRRRARFVGGDRARDRLRKPAHDRERRRRAADRGQPAAPPRRRGRGGGDPGRRRGDRADVHVDPHPRQRPARRARTRGSPRSRSATRRSGAPRRSPRHHRGPVCEPTGDGECARR